MFQREADWKNAATLICDVMRGSASLAMESRASTMVGGQRQTHSARWHYDQTQPHRAVPSAPRLFSPEQLRDCLATMADRENFLAYEASPGSTLGPSAEASLDQFSSAEITLVTLRVGTVITSWALVGLGNSRDLVLWKMRYHLRDVAL